MPIINNKPVRSVGVGALYQCFAAESGYEPDVHKSENIVRIGTTEERTSTPVHASNKVYDEDVVSKPANLTVEVVAYSPANLARMQGAAVNEGFVVRNRFEEGEYFAQGVVFPKRGGHVKYVWYPKCRLVDTTKEAQTSDDSGPNSQNRTVNIQAYEFNDAGDWEVAYDTELLAPASTPMTEAEFFATPLLAKPEEG